MKQRFLNQKLGKRPSYRARLQKAAKASAAPRPGYARQDGTPVAPATTGKRAGTR